MSGMFWIALELRNPRIKLNTSFSLLVMKLNAPKFYEVVKAGNTGQETTVSPKIYVRTL